MTNLEQFKTNISTAPTSYLIHTLQYGNKTLADAKITSNLPVWKIERYSERITIIKEEIKQRNFLSMLSI